MITKTTTMAATTRADTTGATYKAGSILPPAPVVDGSSGHSTFTASKETKQHLVFLLGVHYLQTF